MAPVLATRARRRSVGRRSLRLSRKICVMFPAATVFNLGENQFIFVRETYRSVYWEVQGTFLHGDGLTHTDLPCITKDVIEWGSSKRGDKTERSCSFLGVNEQKL